MREDTQKKHSQKSTKYWLQKEDGSIRDVCSMPDEFRSHFMVSIFFPSRSTEMHNVYIYICVCVMGMGSHTGRCIIIEYAWNERNRSFSSFLVILSKASFALQLDQVFVGFGRVKMFSRMFPGQHINISFIILFCRWKSNSIISRNTVIVSRSKTQIELVIKSWISIYDKIDFFFLRFEKYILLTNSICVNGCAYICVCVYGMGSLLQCVKNILFSVFRWKMKTSTCGQLSSFKWMEVLNNKK